MQLEELSNISDNLAMMPDPALQQFAQMHKQDPYMVSLALSESNRRKKLRTAKQGQAGAMPQPKVVDAAIQSMTPAPAPVAQTQLPENQGIAQIPTPNMQGLANGGIAGYEDDEEGMATGGMGGMFNFAQQSEPVVRMAGGGMAGDGVMNFSNGGTNKLSGATLFEKALDMEGITNPRERAFLKALHGQESSGKATEKTSNRNAHGAMQILPGTFKEVADKDMDINKPLDNMRAGIRYGKKGYAAAGGDPVLAGAYYYGGPGGMQKAAKGIPVSDPENPKAPTTIDYGNSIAKRMTAMLPIGTAQAETRPSAQKAPAAAPVDTSAAAQIPGQAMQAPASNYDQTNSFFGRMADKLGIPLEAQRQIGTTLNAPTPLAPVVGSAKSGSGIVALGEKIGDKLGFLQGPKGRMSAAEIEALQKQSGGLKALEASQQVTREAQAAGATLDEQEYLRKMVEANRAKEAADKYSKSANIAEASMLREGQDVATAQRLSKTGQQAQATGRVDALADKASPTNNAAAGVAPGTIPFKGIDDAELQRMQEANQAPMTGDAIVKAAEEVTPAKERKGFSNDDLLTLGLNLLASKSPNFMTALGEAGLATVAGKKEREKIEREQTKSGVELDYMKARTKEAEAQASFIERGGREKKMELEAEKMIQNHMADWAKSMEGKMGALGAEGPLARQREEDRVRTAIYASLGIPSIIRPQSAASSGGGGFKFLGVQ